MSDASSARPPGDQAPGEAAPPVEDPLLPPLHPGEGAAFAKLLGLIRRLRGPDGCPWDREQNLRTMTPYLIEEAYEVIDAIERDDSEALREELGDLAFLLFFCAEVGREEARFTIDELLDFHRRKMIARHPHVFGSSRRLETGAAAQQWEELKQEEGGGGRSLVDGRLPRLPALTGAYRIQEKAAAVGFDWKEVKGVLDKIEEEIRELRAELGAAGLSQPLSASAAKRPASDGERHELGDLLFALVNLARALHIDPEAALRGATARFMRRFRFIEERLAEQNRRPSQVGMAELDRLWEEAKSREPRLAADSPDPSPDTP